jgi:hypothetical protein
VPTTPGVLGTLPTGQGGRSIEIGSHACRNDGRGKPRREGKLDTRTQRVNPHNPQLARIDNPDLIDPNTLG